MSCLRQSAGQEALVILVRPKALRNDVMRSIDCKPKRGLRREAGIMDDAFNLSYEDFRRAMAIGEAGNNLEKIVEENKKLCGRYPFLIPRDGWTGKPLEDYGYEYTYLDDIPIGWKKAFGVQLCEEIRDLLIEANYLDKYQVVQVKEKYGTLRWYDNGAPESIYDRLQDIIGKYEDISARTCIRCGKPGTMRTIGWVSPWCDDCYKER